MSLRTCNDKWAVGVISALVWDGEIGPVPLAVQIVSVTGWKATSGCRSAGVPCLISCPRFVEISATEEGRGEWHRTTVLSHSSSLSSGIIPRDELCSPRWPFFLKRGVKISSEALVFVLSRTAWLSCFYTLAARPPGYIFFMFGTSCFYCWIFIGGGKAKAHRETTNNHKGERTLTANLRVVWARRRRQQALEWEKLWGTLGKWECCVFLESLQTVFCLLMITPQSCAPGANFLWLFHKYLITTL